MYVLCHALASSKFGVTSHGHGGTPSEETLFLKRSVLQIIANSLSMLHRERLCTRYAIYAITLFQLGEQFASLWQVTHSAVTTLFFNYQLESFIGSTSLTGESLKRFVQFYLHSKRLTLVRRLKALKIVSYGFVLYSFNKTKSRIVPFSA